MRTPIRDPRPEACAASGHDRTVKAKRTHPCISCRYATASFGSLVKNGFLVVGSSSLVALSILSFSASRAIFISALFASFATFLAAFTAAASAFAGFTITLGEKRSASSAERSRSDSSTALASGWIAETGFRGAAFGVGEALLYRYL